MSPLLETLAMAVLGGTTLAGLRIAVFRMAKPAPVVVRTTNSPRERGGPATT
jgi:hypothetical protein